MNLTTSLVCSDLKFHEIFSREIFHEIFREIFLKYFKNFTMDYGRVAGVLLFYYIVRLVC